MPLEYGSTTRSCAGSMATAGGLGAAPPCSSANGRAPSADAEDEDLLDAAVLRRRLPRLVEERRHGDEEARARVPELLGQLVGGVERIDGGVDRRRATRRAWKTTTYSGQVGAVDRDHVALAEAARAPGRSPTRRIASSSCRYVSDAAGRPIDDGRLVAEPAGVPQHVLGDGDVGHRDVGAAAPDDHRGARRGPRASGGHRRQPIAGPAARQGGLGGGPLYRAGSRPRPPKAREASTRPSLRVPADDGNALRCLTTRPAIVAPSRVPRTRDGRSSAAASQAPWN